MRNPDHNPLPDRIAAHAAHGLIAAVVAAAWAVRTVADITTYGRLVLELGRIARVRRIR